MRAWLSVLTALGLCASTYSQGVPVIFPWVPVDNDIFPSLETSAAASDHDNTRLTVIAAWNTLAGPDPGDDRRIGYASSIDGFATPWTVGLLPAPSGVRQFDPMTAFDKETGNLWVGGITSTPPGLCQSDDDCPQGETCNLFGQCTTTTTSGVYVARLDPITGIPQTSVMAFTGAADKAWMAAGPKYGEPGTTRLYIAFNQGLVWSDDLGDADTWCPLVPLGVIAPLPRVGPNGELYVASKTDTDNDIELLRSLDSGVNFTSLPVTDRIQFNVDDLVAGTFKVPTFTYLAVDPIVGTVYVVYHDIAIPGSDNVDIFFTKSDDMGNPGSWTTPVVINFDSVLPGDQFFPWIEVDGYGHIHVLFFDTRNMQPPNDSLPVALVDTYYMFSDNGGNNWTEVLLSEQPWDSSLDGVLQQPGGVDFIGDYLGMAVAGNRVYPMYPNDESMPAIPPGDPDIYTNVICYCLGDCGNCDEVVGIVDFLDLLAQWGQPSPQRCDLDDDDIVGINDFLLLLAKWGACPVPEGSAKAAPPPTLEEELADACLTQDDWDEYVDVMTDEASSQSDKDRYDCWMRHYILDCSRCQCPHTGTGSGCPNPDPFN